MIDNKKDMEQCQESLNKEFGSLFIGIKHYIDNGDIKLTSKLREEFKAIEARINKGIDANLEQIKEIGTLLENLQGLEDITGLLEKLKLLEEGAETQEGLNAQFLANCRSFKDEIIETKKLFMEDVEV